ncbi:MAG: hypothetical protein V3S82_03175 [Dehalococcoidia bacterium]
MRSRVFGEEKAADVSSGEEAVRHLRQAIDGGTFWFLALLEAIGLWTQVEETIDGCRRRYLIEGEAFDWLVLAERLCGELDGVVSPEETEGLLLRGIPPLEMTRGSLQELMGRAKYQSYLNFFYGVVVEEAVVLAVQEEMRKRRLAQGLSEEVDLLDEAYGVVYGEGRDQLLAGFRTEKRYPQRRSTDLGELKEFTYWLFKYRMKRADSARVASDTKKGLDYLRRQWAGKGSLLWIAGFRA